MSTNIDSPHIRIQFPKFYIYRYAGVSDDPAIEDLRTSWEARDILDQVCYLVDCDKELGSWNRMNAICMLRNAQRHLLGVDTWEFTFND